jgi:microcystin-dependent protein
MSQPYVGEIRMFGGNFAPAGWSFCDGQLLPISENDVLFNLIGTTYGGDGQETFALPNLQSRVPLHPGTSPGGITYQLGQADGVETVTLTVNQIPGHNHAVLASKNTGSTPQPQNNVPAQNSSVMVYRAQAGALPMATQMISNTGGSQPHENLQPFACVNFIISLFGVFPTQN